ncbi:hypothetical protein CVT24_002807, partial [Panaeolus cyanescens]
INPSSSSTSSSTVNLDTSSTPSTLTTASTATAQEIDIPKLQRQIRSRYKALCSTIGVRPRLYTATGEEEGDTENIVNIGGGMGDEEGTGADGERGGRRGNADGAGGDDGNGGAGGDGDDDVRMSATGARGRGFIPVWKLDEKGEKKKVTNMDLSF